MKKAISILLALGMVLTLAACGNKRNLLSSENNTEPQKETTETPVASSSFDIENAIVDTPENIWKAAKSNTAKAMQNTYLFKCKVLQVATTYFETEDLSNLRIFLPLEELAKLNVGEWVGIIGKVTDNKTEMLGDGGYREIVEMGEAAIYDGFIPDLAQ